MKSFLAGVLLIVLVTGCAADHSVSVYKLGAEGGWGVIGDVVAAGCIVKVEGESPGGLYVKYNDEVCFVEYGTPYGVNKQDEGLAE